MAIKEKIGYGLLAGAMVAGVVQSPETVTAPVGNTVEVLQNPQEVARAAEYVGVEAVGQVIEIVIPDGGDSLSETMTIVDSGVQELNHGANG